MIRRAIRYLSDRFSRGTKRAAAVGALDGKEVQVFLTSDHIYKVTVGADGIAQPILPSAEERANGTAALHRCLPAWRAVPAFYLVKPATGLVLSLQDASESSEGFQLQFRVEEVLLSDRERSVGEPLVVDCGWNQPYVSFDESHIHAPYCFSLYFEAEGVARARAICQDQRDRLSENAGYREFLLVSLRSCFRSESFGEKPLDLEEFRRMYSGARDQS